MSRLHRAFLSVLCLAAAACAQEPKPVAPPSPNEADAKRLVDEMQQQFKAEKIAIDAKARTVTIDAVMNQPQDPVEYLLIHKRGKRHEAVFITGSKPSVLNAALLLAGMQPGKNATYQEKNPPPSLEEIEKGADTLIVTPPEGKEFWITVKWPDAAGKPVEYCIEDLMLDMEAQGPVATTSWIFLGGRMAQLYKNEPEVYIADFEGNLVSVCYLAPDNHLATMRHERARDDQNWWLTDKCPEPGTAVQLVFHSIKPPLALEREKRVQQEAKKGDAKPGESKTDGKDGR